MFYQFYGNAYNKYFLFKKNIYIYIHSFYGSAPFIWPAEEEKYLWFDETINIFFFFRSVVKLQILKICFKRA